MDKDQENGQDPEAAGAVLEIEQRSVWEAIRPRMSLHLLIRNAGVESVK